MRTVLKIGGSVLEPAPSPELLAAVVARVQAGDELVVVHGGGKALTGLLDRLKIPTAFLRGLRVTDEHSLDAALMALAGGTNKKLVAALHATAHHLGNHTFRAVGVCGVDANCVLARVTDPDLGRVGEVCGGYPELLDALLEAGFTPVLASLASDGLGGILNVNADHFAAACAQLIDAERVVFVTDVEGVLDASGQRIASLNLGELEAMERDGVIRGGMLPKLAACRQVLDAGVDEVEIIGPEAARHLDRWEPGHCPGTRVWKEVVEVMET
mgnify:CR=1 FL=1